MKKVLILGSCGSGKSTIARKISKELNLPLIGLDQCYWKPGWTSTPREEWRNKVKEFVKRDKWIIEGNYRNTLDIRLPACDTIIMFDVNRFICFWRILKRAIFKDRVDPIAGCNSIITFELIKWVLWDYPEKAKKDALKILGKYSDKNIIFIRSNKDFRNIDKLLQ